MDKIHFLCLTYQFPLPIAVKSKTLSARPCHTLSGVNCTIRRTASLDTIYLQGHWPRDSFNLQVDKATQVMIINAVVKIYFIGSCKGVTKVLFAD